MIAGNIITDRGSRATHMRALFCLVVAIFLLSNPFLTLFRAPGDTAVRHPVSHRATIGSSELQHFSPVSGQGTPEASVAGNDSERIPARVEWPVRTTGDEHRVRAAAAELPASLWFRPPPAS
jgi:hypothetical protein